MCDTRWTPLVDAVAWVPGDRVLVTYSLGLTNGGFMGREALWKYSGALPVMTGSGASTPTRRQIEIAKAWGINVILGFPAYLRHMALVARDEMACQDRVSACACRVRTCVEDRKAIEDLGRAVHGLVRHQRDRHGRE